MSKKKSTPNAGATGLPAIRIGTRVRCTDDGIDGRITWANAVSVKIKWDDNEQVTWKRAELASKPIEFLDTEPTEPADARTEQLAAEAAPEQPTPETASSEPLNTTPPGGFAIPRRQRKPKTPAEPKVKKLSALDAAAKVLGETGTPMTCKELIGAMAAKGYWTSPGGRTPDATLAAAIIREIAVKGDKSRFIKAAPGRFALRPTA
jgi:hypothetical protein